MVQRSLLYIAIGSSIFEPILNAGGAGSIGLLVGQLDEGSVVNCHIREGVIVSSSDAGGLIGDNRGTVKACSATITATGAHGLVVECNHCPERLAKGPYPAQLKRRVAGNRGHLSNEQCRNLLERVLHPGLRQVTLAHLSAENNTSALAMAAMEPLKKSQPQIQWAIGSRAESLPPVTLGDADEGSPRKITGQLPLLI